jgi:hypothetical protein
MFGSFLLRFVPWIQFEGVKTGSAVSGTTNSILVLMRDSKEDILFATGTDVPTDTTGGYAKNCLFIDTDVAGGTSGLYTNVGTNTSCEFKLITNA